MAEEIITIPGKHYDSNNYLITGEKPSLIDTGTGRYSQEIKQKLQDMLQDQQLHTIVLTHEHFDHVGGAEELRKHTKATILAHPETSQHVKTKPSPFARLLGMNFTNFSTDKDINDNEVIQLGDHSYTVLHTPGHSNGSICLYQEQKQILFSGDLVFYGGDTGRTDLPGGSKTKIKNSIERLTYLKIKRLYPGHGQIVTTDADQHISKAYAFLTTYY